MQTYSFRRFLLYTTIVGILLLCTNIPPNAVVGKRKYFTTAQQMTRKPCQRLYHSNADDPSIQLPEQHRHLLSDEHSTRRSSHVRPNVTKRVSKASKTIGKSSSSLVIRRSRRSRTVFTNAQVAELESCFMECKYVNSERADELAAKLSIDAAPVKYWFKNQRRRIKVNETWKQSIDILKDDERKASTEALIQAPNFVCQALYISSPSPQPTPPPSASDVGTPYSFNPTYYHTLKGYSTKQATGHHLLQQVATSTPTHIVQYDAISKKVQNAATPHQLSKLQSHASALNFNNMTHLIAMTLPTEDVHSSTSTSNSSDTSDYYSLMSPISEPLTPSSGLNEAESVFNEILDSLKTPKTQPTMEHIYEKLISAPEPNFNCGLDTILQPYNNYQSPTSSIELSYLELA